MIPAMNIDDRTELLGGMRAGAPPEVFEGIWGLTGSVLPAVGLRSARRPPRPRRLTHRHPDVANSYASPASERAWRTSRVGTS